MTRPTRPHCLARRDGGRIAVFFAILAPALIALLGLIIDGGGKVRALQRADNIATEAARAAGQAINAPQAIRSGPTEVDPAQAIAAGQAYIAAAGVTGTVTIAPDLQHVEVTVQIAYHTVVLDFVGIDTITVSGSATATLVNG